MLRTITIQTQDQEQFLNNTFKESLKTNNIQYVTKQFENIRIVQDFVNNLLRLKYQYHYDLFHVTVTWKKTPFCYLPACVQKDFNRFYLRVFLPYLMNQHRLDKSSYNKQPICLAAVESGSKNNNETSNQADLHNHCIIACRGIVSARLIRFHSNSPALFNALKESIRSERSAKKRQVANDLLSYIVAIVVVPVRNDEIQTSYPFKKFGLFSEYVSQFPENIDWSDIQVVKKNNNRDARDIKKSETPYEYIKNLDDYLVKDEADD